MYRYSPNPSPSDNNTVLRAGFAIFYDQTPRPANPVISRPFIIQEPTFTNPADDPSVILPDVYPSGGNRPTVVNPPSCRNPDMRNRYGMQYSAAVQHQQWNTRFRVSYVGTHMRKGMYIYYLNQPPRGRVRRQCRRERQRAAQGRCQ